jgi:hypothetical protein
VISGCLGRDGVNAAITSSITVFAWSINTGDEVAGALAA